MHVLILTTGSPDDAHFLKRRMRVLERRGIEFTVRTVPGSGRSNTEQRSVSEYVRFYLQVLRESRNEYDLVHANYGLTAPIALAQPTRPVVLSLWGSDLHGQYGWVSKRFAPFCDEVVVMSERMRSELGHPCEIIPHGLDLEMFSPQPRDRAREQLGWDDDRYHVFFPYSTDRPVKDYPRAKRIIDAANRELDRPVELHIADYIAHEKIPPRMNAADVVLLTSRREGSPNTVKEAMACNVPIVATDVGDVSERLAAVEPSVVADSDVELISGLVSLLERGDRSNGREEIRHLDCERIAVKLLDVYERAFRGRGRAIPDALQEYDRTESDPNESTVSAEK